MTIDTNINELGQGDLYRPGDKEFDKAVADIEERLGTDVITPEQWFDNDFVTEEERLIIDEHNGATLPLGPGDLLILGGVVQIGKAAVASLLAKGAVKEGVKVGKLNIDQLDKLNQAALQTGTTTVGKGAAKVAVGGAGKVAFGTAGTLAVPIAAASTAMFIAFILEETSQAYGFAVRASIDAVENAQNDEDRALWIADTRDIQAIWKAQLSSLLVTGASQLPGFNQYFASQFKLIEANERLITSLELAPRFPTAEEQIALARKKGAAERIGFSEAVLDPELRLVQIEADLVNIQKERDLRQFDLDKALAGFQSTKQAAAQNPELREVLDEDAREKRLQIEARNLQVGLQTADEQVAQTTLKSPPPEVAVRPRKAIVSGGGVSVQTPQQTFTPEGGPESLLGGPFSVSGGVESVADPRRLRRTRKRG